MCVQRIEHIGAGEDAAMNIDIGALQAARVAGAVPFFVVGQSVTFSATRSSFAVATGQQVRADLAVALHDFEFGLGELARFQQNTVRDAYLADIVQCRRLQQNRDLGLGKAEQVAQHRAGSAHAPGVLGGIGIVMLGRALPNRVIVSSCDSRNTNS